LENIINKYDYLTLGLSMSDTFSNLMDLDMMNLTIEQRKIAKETFESVLYSFIPTRIKNTGYELSIKIYFNHGFNYFNNQSRYSTYDQIDDEVWFQNVISQYNKNRSAFFVIPSSELTSLDPASDNAYFSLIRVVVDKSYYPETLGLIRLDIPNEYLNILIHSNVFDNTLNFVSTKQNELIAVSSADSSLNQLMSSSYDISTFPKESWHSITLSDTKYLANYSTIEPYDLSFVSVIPYKSVFSDVTRIRTFLFATGIILLLVSFALANFISKSISSRILHVIATMKQVKTGKLIHLQGAENQGKDEIGELADTYNYMVNQLELLIQKEYDNGKEIKNAELKILQAQINPHFLYNILDMIHWFSEEEKYQEIGQAVKSLATYYRISLSNGREVITIREELSHVDAYIRLQNLRFLDSIHYSYEIEDSLLDCFIVKTTLQPIVENAIHHGILEKDGHDGKIHIAIRQEDNSIYITVMDNGIGMSEEQLYKLNHNLFDNSLEHGYGIRNVNSRIQLFYGTNYGLSYESTKEMGTTVLITIPYKISQ
jgi:two-component system sensor histidine kinase YesM